MSFLFLEKLVGREPQSPSIPVLVPLRLQQRSYLFIIGSLALVALGTADTNPLASLLCVALIGLLALFFRHDIRESSRIAIAALQNVQSIPTTPDCIPVESISAARASRLVRPLANQVEVKFSGLAQSRFQSIQLSVTENQSVAEFVSNIVANMDRNIELNQFGKSWLITDAGGNTILDGQDSKKALAATAVKGGMKLLVAEKD